jgi:hypothetical protein
VRPLPLKRTSGYYSSYQQVEAPATVSGDTVDQGRHETLRDADILQLGIYWSRFVESQIEQAIGTTQHKARPMVENEVEEFEKVAPP